MNILPGKTVERDALIGGGQVVNAGRVNGTLTVSANQFNNTGSAGKVKFHKVEDQSQKREDYDMGFNIFSLLAMLGYFILGLILVKYLPGIFQAVDGEVRSSTLLKTLLGFVMIIASFIALLLVAATVVGLPIALISTLLILRGPHAQRDLRLLQSGQMDRRAGEEQAERSGLLHNRICYPQCALSAALGGRSGLIDLHEPGLCCIALCSTPPGRRRSGKGSLKYFIFSLKIAICQQLACNGIFAETLKAKYLDIQIIAAIENAL